MSSKWKQEFNPIKTAEAFVTSNPTDVLRENLHLPPLQSIYDLPPIISENSVPTPTKPLPQDRLLPQPLPKVEQIKKYLAEHKKAPSDAPFSREEPLKEGMSTKDSINTTKQSIKQAGKKFKEFKETISNLLFEACLGFLKVDLPFMHEHKEKLTDKQQRADATFCQKSIVRLLIVPLCAYAAYNWYYLLFHKSVESHATDFKALFAKVSGLEFLLGTTLAPVQLVDWLLFTYIPSKLSPKEGEPASPISPIQSVNLLLLLGFLVIFMANYLDGSVANMGGIIAIGVFMVIFIWAIGQGSLITACGCLVILGLCIGFISAIGSAFSNITKYVDVLWILGGICLVAWFTDAIKEFTSVMPPSATAYGFAAFKSVMRLLITIALVPFSETFLQMYLGFYSFFGLPYYEANWWHLWWEGGLDSLIRVDDQVFYNTKPNLFKKAMQAITTPLSGRTTAVAFAFVLSYIMLQSQTSLNSMHAKSVVFGFTSVLLSATLAYLYIFPPVAKPPKAGGMNMPPTTSTTNPKPTGIKPVWNPHSSATNPMWQSQTSTNPVGSLQSSTPLQQPPINPIIPPKPLIDAQSTSPQQQPSRNPVTPPETSIGSPSPSPQQQPPSSNPITPPETSIGSPSTSLKQQPSRNPVTPLNQQLIEPIDTKSI
jgi:hypothetical protein